LPTAHCRIKYILFLTGGNKHSAGTAGPTQDIEIIRHASNARNRRQSLQETYTTIPTASRQNILHKICLAYANTLLSIPTTKARTHTLVLLHLCFGSNNCASK